MKNLPGEGLEIVLGEILGRGFNCHLSTGTVTLKPLTLERLPDLLQLLTISASMDDDGETPVEERQEVSFSIISMVSGISVDEIESLPEGDLERLMSSTQEANPSLFKSDGILQPRSSKGRSDLKGLETSIALLVESGHSLEHVKGYTLAQIERLSLAHARLAAERRINDLVIGRAAQASDKGYKTIAQSLQQALARLG